MRNIDAVIIRLLPIYLFMDMAFYFLCAWNGDNNYPENLLHSNSVIYSLALFAISLSNKKYHCIWNRAMYVQLAITPLISYLDAKFNLIPNVEHLLYLFGTTWILSLIITIALAIVHFVRIQRNKRKKNCYGEFKLR